MGAEQLQQYDPPSGQKRGGGGGGEADVKAHEGCGLGGWVRCKRVQQMSRKVRHFLPPQLPAPSQTERVPFLVLI